MSVDLGVLVARLTPSVLLYREEPSEGVVMWHLVGAAGQRITLNKAAALLLAELVWGVPVRCVCGRTDICLRSPEDCMLGKVMR